jgi:hypothetical protein
LLQLADAYLVDNYEVMPAQAAAVLGGRPGDGVSVNRQAHGNIYYPDDVPVITAAEEAAEAVHTVRLFQLRLIWRYRLLLIVFSGGGSFIFPWIMASKNNKGFIPPPVL